MPDPSDLALLDLLRLLDERGYRFVTPTPATHERVVRRADKRRAADLRDLFGWSLAGAPELLEAPLREAAGRAGILVETDGLVSSRLRVSSLGADLFLHSAYPTEAEDAVFFGPDSYRFAALIAEELGRRPLSPGARVIDVGTGAGVGALAAARASEGASLLLTDINPAALRLASINAAHAGMQVETREASGLGPGDETFELVLINPPYMADSAGRAYRDGGDMHGGRLSLDLSVEAMGRLAPGGRLILYTGSAIVAGEDELHDALRRASEERGLSLSYRELDPDVFGEELDEPAYRDVERIALVAAIVTRDR